MTATKVECILGLCHSYRHAPGLSRRMRREKGRPTASKQLCGILHIYFLFFDYKWLFGAFSMHIRLHFDMWEKGAHFCRTGSIHFLYSLAVFWCNFDFHGKEVAV